MTVKSVGKSDCIKNIKRCYAKELAFITDLLSNVDLPCQESDTSDSGAENKSKKIKMPIKKGTDRAKTLEELHKRIETIREQKYTYKGKKLKNKLQSKLKRKKRVYENKMKRNTTNKVPARNESETEHKKVDIKPPKPIFNSEGNLVFSKFDFLGETSTINKEELPVKETGSKKQILEKLEKKKNFLKKLEQEGDIERASKIKEETAWNNALKKAEGLKVKDDPLLLKKALAKKKAKKKVSEKKWKDRIKNVEKQKEDKQKKRTENLMKRKEEMKKKKIKKSAKKGRYIPKS